MIHGHTDDVGNKDKNFQLGYERALAVYQEIRKHSKELPDHVDAVHPRGQHADSPGTSRRGSRRQTRAAADEARAKNRRITIEDLVVAEPREGK